MVLAERNAESVRNGGRRSRGPSPNGHAGSPESSSDDENSASKKISKSLKKSSEYEAEKIRVGRDYQAVCPELVHPTERKVDQLNDRALLVWSPTKEIPDAKLEEYITVAKEKYGYNGEQALGMLFWHKHDLARAESDLANFTPFPDEWTAEDKVLFEQAFQFHGKSFHRIRQMLPDKSIPSLVKYYYSWKKTRSRTSVMDRQEKIKKNESSENGSENGSNEESDSEEKKWPIHRGIHRASGSPPRGIKDDQVSSSASSLQASTSAICTINSNNTGNDTNNDVQDTKGGSLPNTSSSPSTNASSSLSSTTGGCGGCGVPCNHVNSTPQGKLCNSCYHHWRRTGNLRPTTGPSCFGKRSKNSHDKHKRKPPRGMHINHDDIVALANPDNDQANRNDELLATMDREIVSLWCQIQQNKQTVSSLKRKNSDSSDDLRPPESMSKINSRWNNEELLLAAQGIRKYGKDFQAIAETIGTKTPAQVRLFFVNYRRKYNLDGAMKDFEAENSQQHGATSIMASAAFNKSNGQQFSEDVMEIDIDDDSMENKKEKDVEVTAITCDDVDKIDIDVNILQGKETTPILRENILPTDSGSNATTK
ncbi:REST corepressor 1 isoform X1 [Phlebotomus papatasi]|nr:REST corepressor 1 isoform X1 [Phlebotomus papatasi]